MSTREEIFECWAPNSSIWSPWVKPVVFASLGSFDALSDRVNTLRVESIRDADGTTAIVVNLPGATGVAVGLDLATRGYRPVPLYNAVPAPLIASIVVGSSAAVDVRPIARALVAGSDQVARANLGNDAPPAFLLDWDRYGVGTAPPPGAFDNRSVSFTTDFPSGARLRAQGISRAVVIQPRDTFIPSDLAHTLLRWQQAGIAIEQTYPESGSAPQLATVPKPTWFGFAWQRALAMIGFRAGTYGGFGGWVPEPSSGGFG